MQNLFADIVYATRQFRLSPVFTATAILTLAIGIGGTTAIFSLMDAVMLRSLPVTDPASLYRIGEGTDCCVTSSPQGDWGFFSFRLYQKLQNAAPEFEELAAFKAGGAQFSVRRSGVDRIARPLRGEYVTGNYFSTFGVRPMAGRLLSPADDQASAPPAAVLSYSAWSTHYGSNPSVIGGTFIVEDHPFTVIGISPPGFYGETLRSNPPDLWLPIQQEPLVAGEGSLLRQSFSAWLRVIGRVRPGVKIEAELSRRLTDVLRSWLRDEADFPAAWHADIVRLLSKQTVNIVPAGSGVAEMKENYSNSLQILLAVCGLVLLIACANVANLLLARAMVRREQTSLRLALGASRQRIVFQSLTESVLLSLAGGLAGLIVADGAGRLLLALAFHSSQSLAIDTAPSLPVLAFALGLSFVTGIVFGTAPAWFATRSDPAEALRGSNRVTRDHASLSRQALLILQATLSVVLVAGAVLLTRSLKNLEQQNFGFTAANRVSVELNSPPATYTLDRLDALSRDLETRLRQIPGVERADLALYNPTTDNWGELIVVEGHPPPSMAEDDAASWDRISPGYFETLGQPMLRGRSFLESDSGNSAPVAIVNEAFVRRFFPKENPLDRHFGIDLPENAKTFRIVGVVRNAKYSDPGGKVKPMFFVPLTQHVTYANKLMQQLEGRTHYFGGIMLVSRISPGLLDPQVKKALSDADPNLTVLKVRSLQELIDLNFDQQRALAGLAGLFGGVSLLLAAIGLYGVTAYAVARRTSEIGIRMALGAERMGIVRLVLRGAFQKVLIGLALGVPLAIGAGYLISSKLYNVAQWDPYALTLAVGSLAGCALVAAVIPAMRAASIDPLKALRSD
jgi:predicted permease